MSIVLHINIQQLEAAACKCLHSSLRLLMKEDKYPAQLSFCLRVNTEGSRVGLCWKNNTQWCGHNVDYIETFKVNGASGEVLWIFFLSSHEMKCFYAAVVDGG